MAAVLSVGRADIAVTTYTYKKVGGLEIKADVHRDAASKPGPLPVLLWIHGGALMMGGRENGPRFEPALLAAGFLMVSIDYRLAPETRLPGIIDDVEDAYRWIHERGPKLFGADPNRIAVAGGSAGGYLTLVMGYRARPRPAALVSFWGYGDLVGPWYSEPSPYPRHHRVTVTREEAFRQGSGPPVANDAERHGDAGILYQYCRQQGLWPWAVSGWDPHREPQKFFPYMPVRNVDAGYPPTLLVHGTSDTDVPYEQSVLMAAELGKHGVRCVFIGVPGAEHGLANADPASVDGAYQRALEFLKVRLAPAPPVPGGPGR